MIERTDIVRTPHFPLYSQVKHLLTLLDGVPKSTVAGMIQSLFNQMGTPQNPADWTDPDTWIPQRLSGAQADLAMHIWQQTQHELNPRHIYGSYLFIKGENLLDLDRASIYRLNARSNAFLRDDPTLVRELDEHEGMLKLLQILATKTRAMRGDLLPEWRDFLNEHSHFRALASAKDTLRRRLLNLVERGLIEREGNTYSISTAGIAYIGGEITARVNGNNGTQSRHITPLQQVSQSIQTYNQTQREALRASLATMHPYRFEQLVRDLLEAMGYDNVEVTRESGDKGVDVVATIEFGITTITEVVQVKRHQNNIQRPVLDQLRGALPYHKAIRGTIITLGGFSQGCLEAALFPGAAPIGLIDGEKLLDLLIEHEIGIHKRPIALHELDTAYFTDPTEQDLSADQPEVDMEALRE